jgi:hypothetical protein
MSMDSRPFVGNCSGLVLHESAGVKLGLLSYDTVRMTPAFVLISQRAKRYRCGLCCCDQKSVLVSRELRLRDETAPASDGEPIHGN